MIGKMTTGVWALIVLGGLLGSNQASALECSTPFQIQQTFANGAAWEMCFEEQNREGVVLRDIHYTSPTGVKRRVLYQANLAQIHVPYDDDGARYHDVSDFGLGGSRLNDLTPADCPDGTLVQNGTKDVICQTVHDAATLATQNEVRYGEVLSVFSVSHVGAYNYVPDWRFFDDGTIEPAIGATGRLQRYTNSEAFGWPVRTGTSPVGVSHIHNYYWRLDFDLDGGDDDRFEELEFVDASGGRRELRSTQFSTEAARSINASTQRFWRVYDAGTQSGSGRSISYDIIPLDTGHRDIGPTFEPWTFNDIYATSYRACERFVSHNPADSAGGCSSNGHVAGFVNGEAIDTSDLVLWFGVTFHHTPRDEDEAYMNAHWNSFRMVPRDWLDVGSSNSNPVLESLANRLDTVGDSVNFSATAVDPDGGVVSFSADGLPPGISISANGQFSGTLSASGTYAVTLRATDSLSAFGSRSFQWNVQAADGCANCVSFVTVETAPYAGQDVAGNVQVQDVGATLYLQDNTWRRTATSFDITPNSILEFEFASSSQGEVHGIGFDADDTVSQNQIFQLYGTQTWGLQNYANYTPSGFVSYRIPVGEFFTGNGMRMVFLNDFDAGSGNTSRYRNVRVFEAAGSVPPVLPPALPPTSNPEGQNVALGGTATQISELAVGIDLGAAKANDGGRGGDFVDFTLAHTDAASQPWWEIDLGARYELSRVDIFNRTDCCSNALQNFHVLVSDVPFTQTTLAGAQSQTGVLDVAHPGAAGEQTTLAVNRSGRFVRIQLEGTDYLQLAEVEIYGTPAEGGNNNFAPLVDNPGDQASVVGANTNLIVGASDIENDVLSFFSSGLPAGLDLNAETGQISGTPTADGNYAVTIEVSDGGSNTSITFNWLVSASSVGQNVALTGIASQSSTLEIGVDLGAANAIDGDRSGSYPAHAITHTRAQSEAWWQIDLGARYNLSQVVIFNREDCCSEELSDYHLFVSDTPFASQTVAGSLSQNDVTSVFTSGVSPRENAIGVNRTGRYVRIQLTSAQHLQLAEVEVYGVPL